MSVTGQIAETVFIGVCTGFGSAVGNYFALKYAIQHMDKIPSVKELIRKTGEKNG